MKLIKILAVSAISVAMLCSCNSTPKVDVELPSSALVDSTSYLIGIQFGAFIKNYNFAEDLSDLDFSMLKKGMNDFIKAKGDFRDEAFNEQFAINPESMNQVFDKYLKMRNEYAGAVAKAEGEKFLADIYNKGGVVKTESGLLYEILEAGNDVKPAETDTVWCNYKGTLVDGTEFDASKDEPVRFMLNGVIAGWTEGLQLIGEGGKIKLYIPSDLAYGERGTRGIKPNSTLIFEIELTKVGKTVAKESAEEPAKKPAKK